jgi:SAM-dependent methyltransferase/uncharacterized protein YbaR (Trm112 family)
MLRCPFCGGRLAAGDARAADGAYGTLRCHCDEYPIVAGIPVLQKSRTVSTLRGLVKAGRCEEALLSAVGATAPPRLAPSWVRSLLSLRGLHGVKRLAHRHGLAGWRARAIDLLVRRRHEVTACEVLAFLFEGNPEANYYFALRFGQPRFLVALSLASIVPEPTRPVLDLACGCGHLLPFLSHRAAGQPVIGLDRFFAGLYIAKHWIAPEASYVCGTTDGPLPFPDGAFAASLCSDAFHYFEAKTLVARELDRVTRHGGPILLSWVHNALIRVDEDGIPLPPAGYDGLFSHVSRRLVADGDVLARYLEKRGPALASPTDVERLARAPLISIVASRADAIFQNYDGLDDWPHAGGVLRVNPLYREVERTAEGGVRLVRAYPSAHFAREHADSRGYLPETVTLAPDVVAALAAGRRTPSMEPLIARCVLVAMPDRFR